MPELTDAAASPSNSSTAERATSLGVAGVLLTVAYNGSQLSGWARQPTARTAAGELLGAIHAIDPQASAPRGVSRTDAGVHARGQRAAFDTRLTLEPRSWVLALTRHLPADLAVTSAQEVPIGFEPRAVVLAKTYRYTILQSEVRDPFLERRCWRVGHRLNHLLMVEEATSLLGTHDFRAFRGAQDERDNTVRSILDVHVRPSIADDRCLEVTITGDRFLYHMVRIITGTLVDVGRGRAAPGCVAKALASGDRRDLGITAPPDGLCLEHVELKIPEGRRWPTP